MDLDLANLIVISNLLLTQRYNFNYYANPDFPLADVPVLKYISDSEINIFYQNDRDMLGNRRGNKYTTHETSSSWDSYTSEFNQTTVDPKLKQLKGR